MNRNLIFMWMALLTWGVGEGMFMIFQPVYLQQLGASPVLIGTLLGGVGIAMALSPAPVGMLADRLGSRRLIWIAWITGWVATMMMGFARSLPLFAAGMLLYGVTAAVSTPLNSYMTGVRGKLSVQRVLTTGSAVFNLGMIAGPTLGGWIGQKYGLQAPYLCAAAIFTLSTCIVLTIQRQPVETHSVHSMSKNLLSAPLFRGFIFFSFLTTFALYLPQPLTPNFLRYQNNISLETLGALGSIGSIGSTVVALALGGLKASLGYMIGQVFVWFFALLMWRSNGLWVFGVSYFLLSGYRLYRLMAITYAHSLIPNIPTGLAYGMTDMINNVAVMLAPLLAGVLYTRSPNLVYPVSLVLITLMLPINALFLLRHQRAAALHQASDLE